jgi:hypothetical protein
MKIDFKPNEVVIKAGDTDRYITDNKINGKLIVTNQRIYFKTKREEHKSYDLEINPHEIKEIHYFNTMWILPNGLNIKTKIGGEFQFLVKSRQEWSNLINKMY